MGSLDSPSGSPLDRPPGKALDHVNDADERVPAKPGSPADPLVRRLRSPVKWGQRPTWADLPVKKPKLTGDDIKVKIEADPAAAKAVGKAIGKAAGPTVGATIGGAVPMVGSTIGKELGKSLGPHVGAALGPAVGKAAAEPIAAIHGQMPGIVKDMAGAAIANEVAKDPEAAKDRAALDSSGLPAIPDSTENKAKDSTPERSEASPSAPAIPDSDEPGAGGEGGSRAAQGLAALRGRPRNLAQARAMVGRRVGRNLYDRFDRRLSGALPWQRMPVMRGVAVAGQGSMLTGLGSVANRNPIYNFLLSRLPFRGHSGSAVAAGCGCLSGCGCGGSCGCGCVAPSVGCLLPAFIIIIVIALIGVNLAAQPGFVEPQFCQAYHMAVCDPNDVSLTIGTNDLPPGDLAVYQSLEAKYHVPWFYIAAWEKVATDFGKSAPLQTDTTIPAQAINAAQDQLAAQIKLLYPTGVIGPTNPNDPTNNNPAPGPTSEPTTSPGPTGSPGPAGSPGPTASPSPTPSPSPIITVTPSPSPGLKPPIPLPASLVPPDSTVASPATKSAANNGVDESFYSADSVDSLASFYAAAINKLKVPGIPTLDPAKDWFSLNGYYGYNLAAKGLLIVSPPGAQGNEGGDQNLVIIDWTPKGVAVPTPTPTPTQAPDNAQMVAANALRTLLAKQITSLNSDARGHSFGLFLTSEPEYQTYGIDPTDGSYLSPWDTSQAGSILAQHINDLYNNNLRGSGSIANPGSPIYDPLPAAMADFIVNNYHGDLSWYSGLIATAPGNIYCGTGKGVGLCPTTAPPTWKGGPEQGQAVSVPELHYVCQLLGNQSCDRYLSGVDAIAVSPTVSFADELSAYYNPALPAGSQITDWNKLKVLMGGIFNDPSMWGSETTAYFSAPAVTPEGTATGATVRVNAYVSAMNSYAQSLYTTWAATQNAAATLGLTGGGGGQALDLAFWLPTLQQTEVSAKLPWPMLAGTLDADGVFSCAAQAGTTTNFAGILVGDAAPDGKAMAAALGFSGLAWVPLAAQVQKENSGKVYANNPMNLRDTIGHKAWVKAGKPAKAAKYFNYKGQIGWHTPPTGGYDDFVSFDNIASGAAANVANYARGTVAYGYDKVLAAGRAGNAVGLAYAIEASKWSEDHYGADLSTNPHGPGFIVNTTQKVISGGGFAGCWRFGAGSLGYWASPSFEGVTYSAPAAVANWCTSALLHADGSPADGKSSNCGSLAVTNVASGTTVSVPVVGPCDCAIGATAASGGTEQMAELNSAAWSAVFGGLPHGIQAGKVALIPPTNAVGWPNAFLVASGSAHTPISPSNVATSTATTLLADGKVAASAVPTMLDMYHAWATWSACSLLAAQVAVPDYGNPAKSDGQAPTCGYINSASAATFVYSGSVAISGYQPPFVTERDARFTHKGGWSDCQITSGLMLVEKMTLGGVPATRAEVDVLRALTGVPRPKGTSIDDIARAIKARYGFSISRPNAGLAITWSTFKVKLSSGDGAVLDGLYSQLGSDYTYWDPGFAQSKDKYGNDDSRHAMYIDRYDPTTDKFWVMDPLGNKAAGYTGEWIPSANLKAYAMGMSFGAGYLQVSLAPEGQYAKPAASN